jgi:hypothetical protein
MWNKHNCISCNTLIDDYTLKREQQRSGLECPKCYIEHHHPVVKQSLTTQPVSVISTHIAYPNELAINQWNKARKTLKAIQKRIKPAVEPVRQQLLLPIEGVM